MSSATQEVTLIGLCDGELDSKRHRSSYLTNKVGGHPDWSPVISRQSPRCSRCGAPLLHVVQVYCPLEASPYHRNLHLFACPGAECSGRSDSWKVLRSQCLEEAAAASRPVPAQEAPPSATDWCDTADDWGMEEEEEDGWGGGVKKISQVQEEAAAPEAQAAAEMDVSSRLQYLNLGETQEDVPVLRSFFISVEEESDLGGEEDDLRHAQQLLREYERREGVAVGELEDSEGGGGEEKYEKTRARHGDAVFSRFMKKISLCPQQILRYCRSGKPLFITEPPANMAQVVSACGSCGGSRTFELQLMPALVSLLRREGGSAEAELEFGTVLVYTCTNSCWTAGSGSAVEEFCFVQADPDQLLFK
ncbi:programmed cell death protein 2-like isoform X1 [Epinephelus fuscoguttatus]|uniref:programmed cell death protein 2-like isoform X1 n=1 Tax=Epinephelus fuscoguttatus TaxID=293821 RepID=UPI0020D01058|nr:programmed cell death protein 2-like isoform X1 [Epinephelus fuscoguttatus]